LTRSLPPFPLSGRRQFAPGVVVYLMILHPDSTSLPSPFPPFSFQPVVSVPTPLCGIFAPSPSLPEISNDFYSVLSPDPELGLPSPSKPEPYVPLFSVPAYCPSPDYLYGTVTRVLRAASASPLPSLFSKCRPKHFLLPSLCCRKIAPSRFYSGLYIPSRKAVCFLSVLFLVPWGLLVP